MDAQAWNRELSIEARLVWSLGRVNRVLAGLVLLVLVAFGMDWFFSSPPSLSAERVVDAQPAVMQERQQAREFAYYAARLGRKLFAGKRRNASVPGAALTVEGVVGQLELQRIFMDDNPQALIFDRKADRSFRVAQGKSIGSILVQEVREDGVILLYQGKTLKLSL